MKDVDLSWVDVCLLRKQRKDHRKKKEKKRDKNNNKKMNNNDYLNKIKSKINKMM